MKDLHSFGWYAARVSPHLPKKAFEPVPARLWGGLAYFILIAGLMTTIAVFDLHPLINLAISIIIGFSFAAVGFLGHEFLHGTVVRNKTLYTLLGGIFMSPFGVGPRLWRKWHNMTHHAHTQDLEKDPDIAPTIDQIFKSKLLRPFYILPQPVRAFLFNYVLLFISFEAHSTNQFFRFLKTSNSKDKVKLWVQFIMPRAFYYSLIFVMGFGNWVFAFLLPMLIGNFISMAYISTNHRLNPLVPVNDPLANSLTVTLPKWVNVLHFNFSYHTEHHLFPGMSSKYYPLVQEKIKEMWPERYHEMPMMTAMKALYKTPRVYYNDKEFVDPKPGKVFGTVGHGLDPDNLTFRKVDANEVKNAEVVPVAAQKKKKI
jgi:fatty acid desaturase